MKAIYPLTLALFGPVLASPISTARPRGQDYDCETFLLPISVSNVPTAILPVLHDQYEATNLLNIATNRIPATDVPQLVESNGTYDILTQYCAPKHTNSSSTLQILTHGLGFNLSYWDFYPSANSSDDQYNYIADALAHGYSTLSYNRLGISGSSMPDPFSEVQTTIEVAILAELTIKARAGEIPGQQDAPSKVVHVGHSFGSFLGNALVANYPELSDGLVLTGYSHILAYNVLFVANSNFLLANVADSVSFPASRYPSGYGTWPSKWANQYSFFAYPNFDKAVLEDAETTKQPFTLGEVLTFPLLTLDAPNFANPVLYLNGERDLIFCASNCTGLIEPGSPAFAAFNGTEDVESVIVPGFGHGMNLHLDAKDKMYSIVDDWLARKGF